MRFLILILLLGCNATTHEPKTSESVASREAVQLHRALFSAADQKNIEAFSALLTPESVELLDRYFEFMNAMPKPENDPPMSWQAFLALHAQLPDIARSRSPYPLKQVKGQWKIDLAGHPDSNFFRAQQRSKLSKPQPSLDSPHQQVSK